MLTLKEGTWRKLCTSTFLIFLFQSTIHKSQPTFTGSFLANPPHGYAPHPEVTNQPTAAQYSWCTLLGRAVAGCSCLPSHCTQHVAGTRVWIWHTGRPSGCGILVLCLLGNSRAGILMLCLSAARCLICLNLSALVGWSHSMDETIHCLQIFAWPAACPR